MTTNTTVKTWLSTRAPLDTYAVPFAALANRALSILHFADVLAELRYKHITAGERREFALRTQHGPRCVLRNSVRELLSDVPRVRREYAEFGARTDAIRSHT